MNNSFEQRQKKSEQIFRNTGIQIVTGNSVILALPMKKEYLKKKVEECISNVEKLSEVRKHELQSSYAAFTNSVQSQWTYFQRVLYDDGISFQK